MIYLKHNNTAHLHVTTTIYNTSIQRRIGFTLIYLFIQSLFSILNLNTSVFFPICYIITSHPPQLICKFLLCMSPFWCAINIFVFIVLHIIITVSAEKSGPLLDIEPPKTAASIQWIIATFSMSSSSSSHKDVTQY